MITSCTKEEDSFTLPYDTIYPGPYLPVYPGSFWNYNSGTVRHSTYSNYILHSFEYVKDNRLYESKPCYIPYWNGIPVYKYSSPIGWTRYGIPQSDLTQQYFMLYFLSETIDENWIDSAVSNKYYNWESMDKVVAVNISIVSGNNSYDSVIAVQHFFGSDYQKSSTNYFAKNIGLVRVDDAKDSTILILDNYFINH
jgi:hypothetical protein